METIYRWLTHVYLLLVAFQFSLGGLLTEISIRPIPISIQGVLTLITYLILFLLAIIRLPIFPRGHILFLLIGVVILFAGIEGMHNNNADMYQAQYLINLSAFFLSFSLIYYNNNKALILAVIVKSAFILCIISTIIVIQNLGKDNRALEMTASFGILILLWYLVSGRGQAFQRYVTLALVYISAYAVFSDSARSAILTIIAGFFVIPLFSRKPSLLIRATLAFSIIPVFLLSLSLNDYWVRWFYYNPSGHRDNVQLVTDNAIIGPIELNAFGRKIIWTHILEETSNRRCQDQLFGSGVGTSSKLTLQVSQLDKPLNEFLRIYVDFGFLGLLFWIATLLFLAIAFMKKLWCNCLPQSDASPLGIATLFGLFVYSSFDNIFSYGWLMIMLGILLGAILAKDNQHALKGL